MEVKPYTKRINITDTNSVHAEVLSPDGRRVGLAMISEGFTLSAWGVGSNKGLEETLAKANNWADERIRIAETWEII